MTIGVVSGSFDIVTKGHIWMIKQALTVVDKLYVAIAVNPEKKGYFTPEENKAMMTQSLTDSLSDYNIGRVDVVLTTDLLANFAKSVGANVICRGIRDSFDLNYENTIQGVNNDLQPSLTHVYFLTPPELAKVSSSIVRGLVKFDGWEPAVAKYVPDAVFHQLKERNAIR